MSSTPHLYKHQTHRKYYTRREKIGIARAFCQAEAQNSRSAPLIESRKHRIAQKGGTVFFIME